jgi:putative ABC transport system ATP-binding protein
VRCRGVRKGFGEGQARVEVLRGMDFEAPAGELTFLVGPSGCGKTTLISIVGAILGADAGQVEVLGEELGRLSARRLADFRLANFGFIFQQFNLLPALSAVENAAVPLVASGPSHTEARRAAGALLERLGLGAHAAKRPAQLSGGQQQRVAIARALVHSPRLVISDEPTASLDADAGRTVMGLLRDLALDGSRSVIVVTHDTRIFEFADRIAFMSDGVITRVESPASGTRGTA